MSDTYRTTLFKKHIREVIQAPWLRFYFSVGKCHLCIEASDFLPEDVQPVIKDLKRSGIDFKISRWSNMSPLFPDSIRTIDIPIDQLALPERKRLKGKKK